MEAYDIVQNISVNAKLLNYEKDLEFLFVLFLMRSTMFIHRFTKIYSILKNNGVLSVRRPYNTHGAAA